jgi:hypothetical protein
MSLTDRSGKWCVWVGRCGFGFRVRWIEVQVYWYGWRGDR